MSTSSISFPQMGKFHSILRKEGVSGEQFQIGFLESGVLDDLAQVIASGRLLDRCKLREAIGLEPLNLWAAVDYDVPIEDLIRMGNYDEVKTRVAWRHFPRKEETGKVELTFELVSAHPGIRTAEDAIAELDRFNLVPAGLQELLVFGAKYPGVQRRMCVYQVGTRVKRRNTEHGAALWESAHWSAGRNRLLWDMPLDGSWHRWHSSLRVLGVRK